MTIFKPLFITFEGGEGAGKSTVLEQLSVDLQAKGFTVVKTREPGGTSLGNKIRTLLLHEDAVNIRAELLLFLASRAQHVEEVIKPALKAGKIVLCDRFQDSSVAYQGTGRGLGSKTVEELSLFATNGLKPDITLLFDIDPQVGLRRRGGTEKGNLDRIEKEALDFHVKIREGFLALQKQEPQRIHLLDASQARDLVYKDVLNIVKSFL